MSLSASLLARVAFRGLSPARTGQQALWEWRGGTPPTAARLRAKQAWVGEGVGGGEPPGLEAHRLPLAAWDPSPSPPHSQQRSIAWVRGHWDSWPPAPPVLHLSSLWLSVLSVLPQLPVIGLF